MPRVSRCPSSARLRRPRHRPGRSNGCRPKPRSCRQSRPTYEQITEVRIEPLAAVDMAHAIDEGEGYESVADWRSGHEEFSPSPEFRAAMRDPNFTVSDATEAVLVRAYAGPSAARTKHRGPLEPKVPLTGRDPGNAHSALSPWRARSSTEVGPGVAVTVGPLQVDIAKGKRT